MSSQIVLVQESGDTANYPFPNLLLEMTYFHSSPSTDREVIPLLSCSENKALLCQTETCVRYYNLLESVLILQLPSKVLWLST